MPPLVEFHLLKEHLPKGLQRKFHTQILLVSDHNQDPFSLEILQISSIFLIELQDLVKDFE